MNRRAGKRVEEPWYMRLGPLRLDWTINVTAVAAFLFSLLALSQQTVGYWRGATVTLHPADKAYLSAIGGTMHAGTRMVYTNDGAPGYNALVLKESATIQVGDHTIRLWSEERGRIVISQQMLRLESPTDAAPFVVPATQLVTHESFFSPREEPARPHRWQNRLTQAEFAELIAKELKRGDVHLTFSFNASTRQVSGLHAGRETVLTTRCVITLDAGLVGLIRNEGYAARTCH